MIVYLARHILSVASPPVRNGAIAVHAGRITAVGRRKDVQKTAGPDAELRDLGDTVVVPGLVNAHTHLELSWLGGDPPSGGDYVAWVRQLLARRAGSGSAHSASARAAAESALEQARRCGTAAVADIGNEGWAAAVLARSELLGIAFLEVYGFRSGDAERILEDAARRLDETDGDPDVAAARARISAVLTPHASHTCSHPLLRALAGRAAAAHERLSIHVAESAPECELLATGTGPMAELLKERGTWDESFRPAGLSPVEYLDRTGILTPRTLAVHCVHLDHQDLSKLQSRGVTVVTCPRSNRHLGVGKAPVPKLLSAGIPVALGTDSLASAPDLNLFAELGALRAEHPGIAPAAALRMATLTGAAGLGLARDLGSIEVGKLARLVSVPLDDPDDDPFETVTTNPPEVFPLFD